MKLFLKKVHTYFYRYSVGSFYIILWPVMYYLSRKPERYNSMNKVRRFWGLVSSGIAGITYRFEFEEPIDWSRTYVICPNHTSNLDISAVSILTKNNFSFMGKEELLKGFVTGLYFRTIDIPVNRKSTIASFRAFKKAGDRLDNGMSMVIFPEGTISGNYPPRLVEFKSGAFRLAIEKQVPIIPVTALDTWRVLWDDGLKYGSKPGVCHIFVHKPIETKGMTVNDADELRDKVYEIMDQKLQSVL